MHFAKTRTSFIASVIFCILLVISKSKHSYKKILNLVAQFIVPIFAGLTLLCVNLYMLDNQIAVTVNKLLSDRIKLGAYGVSHYGFSFLGQNVEKENIVWEAEWGFNGFTFDNVYTYIAVNQGIIWILVLTVLFYLLAKKKNLKISVFVIVWALYGVTEVHGLNGFYCFPIFLVVLLFRRGVSVKER